MIWSSGTWMWCTMIWLDIIWYCMICYNLIGYDYLFCYSVKIWYDWLFLWQKFCSTHLFHTLICLDNIHHTWWHHYLCDKGVLVFGSVINPAMLTGNLFPAGTRITWPFAIIFLSYFMIMCSLCESTTYLQNIVPVSDIVHLTSTVPPKTGFLSFQWRAEMKSVSPV